MSQENSDPAVLSPSALPALSEQSPAARTFTDVLSAMAESVAQLTQLVSADSDEFSSVTIESGKHSSVQDEARRLEDSYRNRYAENALAMTALDSVINSGNPDVKEPITRDNLQLALKNVQTLTMIEPDFAVEFIAGAKYLINRWNNMHLSPYKANDGSITYKSAANGKERMMEEQRAISERIVATEVNARALHKSIKLIEVLPMKPIEPKEAIVKQAEARKGEGPYQVAARVLESDGKPVDVKQLKELADVFKRVFEEERKSQLRFHDVMDLTFGHQFINNNNAARVFSLIVNPELKLRMEGILGQDRVMPAPLIRPIPPRYTSSRLRETA